MPKNNGKTQKRVRAGKENQTASNAEKFDIGLFDRSKALRKQKYGRGGAIKEQIRLEEEGPNLFDCH